VFFLFEILGGLRVHPVQYFLAGAANIMFYLLLLAFSEHIGFNISYFIAAASVTFLISFYSGSITGRNSRSTASVPAVLSVAYLWLWITLQSEDYALLIGSAGLFLIITLLMVLTRKVDWYAGEQVGTGISDWMDISSEGNQRESGELEVLFPEGEPDDGDSE
jgi:inner membrane protein